MRLHATRRTFIRAVATAGLTLPLTGPRLVRAASPNGRLRLGAVGVAGKGWEDLIAASGEGERHDVIAICDIDHRGGGERPDNLGPAQTARPLGIGEAAERFPKAARYADYRKMLDEVGDKLDICTISTPDHMHASVAVPAMELDTHVYVQKPLTQTVHEARVLRQIAEQRNLITQMGNQFHSSRGYRCLVDVIRDGPIGRIKAVHAWTASPSWPQGIDRPEGQDPVPEGVHWDLWLGVAEPRPFKKHTYHNFNWRGWQEFGTGALGDMGCHILDPAVWSLELGPPESVIAENESPNGETYPASSTVRYRFPGTQYTTDTVDVTWYDGGALPDVALARMPEGRNLPRNGSIFIGEEGTLVTSHHPTIPRLYPEEKFADYMQQEVRSRFESLESLDHYKVWTDAVLANELANSPFQDAGPLAESVLVGTIAQRLPGRQLQWDAAQLAFPSSEEATALVRRPYRAGFRHPRLTD